MKNIVLQYAVLLIIALSSSSCNTYNCKDFLTNGAYEVLNRENTYIYIQDGTFIEFNSEEKSYIKTTQRWIGKCSFTLELVNHTLDDSFVFKRGDQSKIELKKIDGDKIEGILSNDYGQGPIILLKVESMPEKLQAQKST